MWVYVCVCEGANVNLMGAIKLHKKKDYDFAERAFGSIALVKQRTLANLYHNSSIAMDHKLITTITQRVSSNKIETLLKCWLGI